jgi:Raf kinase inhibitor-like YbhB/YbcL family protein
MRRRALLTAVGTALAGGVAGCAGTADDREAAFAVASSPLAAEGELPARFTCAGAGESPPFTIERVPEPTAALAVTAEYDRGPLDEPVFWTLWNVPADVGRIPAGLPRTGSLASLDGARQGRQPGGDPGYEPPCPPRGQPYEHRFQVYALGETISLDGGVTNDDAAEAIGNVVLASRRFTVDYTRPPADA